MTRENLLFAIIGLLLGFIIGFMWASARSQREAISPNSLSAQRGQSLPPNHPPIGSDAGADPQQTMEQVQATIKKARGDPKDFDAQILAAKLEYQIRQYDEAIKFLSAAYQLQPNNFDVLAMLGEANMDAQHWDEAEKWYRKALAKKPDDMPALDGLCNVLLGKGDRKAAADAINKLAKIDPNNEDLAQFRERLASLK
jgi:tetratricopeptide (TPR) repeat protein